MSFVRRLSYAGIALLLAPAIGLWTMVAFWEWGVDSEFGGGIDWGVIATGSFASAVVVYLGGQLARTPKELTVRLTLAAFAATTVFALALAWAFTVGPWSIAFSGID